MSNSGFVEERCGCRSDPADRRRTRSSLRGAERLAYVVIAEEAYRLYVAGGCDRATVSECWRAAVERVLAPIGAIDD